MPRSYEKIDYTIRPAKQIERKLIVETFQELTKVGFPISQYTYVGMGSIYYAYFITFPRILAINSMICVERENIPKRMKFNKPYGFIRVFMKDVCDIIPELNSNKKYIVVVHKLYPYFL